jgi:molybdopterin-containing oxidoreductase family iron-sulfur binding subunit
MSDHEHRPWVDNHPPTAEERELREYPLNLTTVRQKLGTQQGRKYWRTLDELAADPHFEDILQREYPRGASEWDESVDRRDFLKLMGASLALAGMAGCGLPPEQHIVPYVKQPDGLGAGQAAAALRR